MKMLSFLFVVFTSTTAIGQSDNDNTSNLSLDTLKKPTSNISLRVEYVYKNKPVPQPAFFVNGNFIINDGSFNNLDPNQIETINVLKKDTLIDNVPYSGQIYIKTKSSYSPEFISLADLKNKYTDFKEKPVVFILDGNVINGNYDKYKVDENNLLTIIVDKMHIDNEKMELGVIKLVTKSEENIKNRNRIMIRGAEVSKNN